MYQIQTTCGPLAPPLWAYIGISALIIFLALYISKKGSHPVAVLFLMIFIQQIGAVIGGYWSAIHRGGLTRHIFDLPCFSGFDEGWLNGTVTATLWLLPAYLYLAGSAFGPTRAMSRHNWNFPLLAIPGLTLSVTSVALNTWGLVYLDHLADRFWFTILSGVVLLVYSMTLVILLFPLERMLDKKWPIMTNIVLSGISILVSMRGLRFFMGEGLTLSGAIIILPLMAGILAWIVVLSRQVKKGRSLENLWQFEDLVEESTPDEPEEPLVRVFDI